MGILDDFIKRIRGQRGQYKGEQKKAEEERAAKERRAEEQRRQGKPSDYGYVGDVADRMKEQRRQFEEAQKKAAEEQKHPQAPAEHRGPIQEFEHRIKEQRKEFEEASKGQKPAPKHAETGTIQEQKPAVINAYGHTFTHLPGQQQHVLFDDAGKAVYIDDVDAYSRSGGKVEQREITAAMDPYMYDIYTSKGGPVGQARYYKAGGMVVSLVPDPFRNYR